MEKHPTLPHGKSLLPFRLDIPHCRHRAIGQAYVPLISTADLSDIWIDVHSCTDFDFWWAYRNIYTGVAAWKTHLVNTW